MEKIKEINKLIQEENTNDTNCNIEQSNPNSLGIFDIKLPSDCQFVLNKNLKELNLKKKKIYDKVISTIHSQNNRITIDAKTNSSRPINSYPLKLFESGVAGSEILFF